MNKHLTPIKSIRAKCLNCCCYQPVEVRLCTAVNCPLFSYRMGKRPKKTQDNSIISAKELTRQVSSNGN